MKNVFSVKILTPLAKVFPDAEPSGEAERASFGALRGETVSFQVAFASDANRSGFARVGVESPLADFIRVRQVSLVPCELPAYVFSKDENYLRTAPGLYPDLLEELRDGLVKINPCHWKSLWVDVCVTDKTPSGNFPIRIELTDTQNGGKFCDAEAAITIHDATLPELPIMRTEWFHGDCLADYYKTPVFSEEHWSIMERFVALAVKRDINMILTPQFTPPLDTAVGGERTTIQLVGVSADNGAYTFDFTRLKRWVDMCLRVGVGYFEMSHLFTQWGAKTAPKIMATVGGEYKRVFGWDTPSTGGEYTRFLRAYLPRLTAKLKEWGIADKTVFHISDEPSLAQYDDYRAAKNSIADLLDGFIILDALSNHEFYTRGAVTVPVVAIDHIKPFSDAAVKPLWSYFCCGQSVAVCNRFMSMPSARARVYGALLFKYDIAGALHWGYNFYNSAHSLRRIDPYRVTDADCAFPSGDAFLVYPGADGAPEESLRMMTLYHAMTDLRAMRHLAALAGRDYVLRIIEEGLPSPLTFTEYPKSNAYSDNLRERINSEIDSLTRK